MIHSNPNPTHPRRRGTPAPRRRGNAMILVAGILVLLVIIAAAFVSRTQAGRVTSSAVQKVAMRGSSTNLIADSLAAELTDALFVWPVDPFPDNALLPNYSDFLKSNAADSRVPRLEPDPNYALRFSPVPGALRYGVDPTDVYNNTTGNIQIPGDGITEFAYNFAPYHTVPYTNWPDDSQGGFSVWPKGEGSPVGVETAGQTPFQPLNVGNPVGNPGFGDSRWLRDLEPLRWDTHAENGQQNVDTAFKYWRHMTNISRANNSWRIVRNISDVFNANGDGVGGLMTDLNIPVEQWLSNVQPGRFHFSDTGDATLQSLFGPSLAYTGYTDFVGKWMDWLSRAGYINAYRRSDLIPPNFYNLSDLDGDGTAFNYVYGDRIGDEFRGPLLAPPFGTARWNVASVLADADGDGFTDSFWFHAPGGGDTTIREIVAVSIVDNSAMLNVNVATRFSPDNTLGETPSDLALVGDYEPAQLGTIPPNWNVGYLDTFLNRESVFRTARDINPYGSGLQVAWGDTRDPDTGEPSRWVDHLVTTGWRFDRDDTNEWWSRFDRRLYWLNKASRPFDPAPGLRPFDLSDEIELRMFNGQNYPWIVSRFERTTNLVSGGGGSSEAFLRSAPWFRESTEYLDQLNNTELKYDHRHRLTLFNGARNDLLPPWLRYRWVRDINGNWFLPSAVQDDIARFGVYEDVDDNGVDDIIDRFVKQANSKVDLREDNPATFLYGPWWGPRYLHERLPYMVMNALMDGNGIVGNSYFGKYDRTLGQGSEQRENFDEVREVAAGFTANVLARRDGNDIAPLLDNFTTGELGAIPLPEWQDEPADLSTRMLGVERQPFLLEAFICHVYKSNDTVPGPPAQYWFGGAPYVVRDMPHTTIVVVQIANPFFSGNTQDPCLDAIDLSDYEINVCDRRLSLSNVQQLLCQGTDENPQTAIFYLIDDAGMNHPGFKEQWLDFLDIEQSDLAPGTLVIDVSQLGNDNDWSTDRTTYDDFGGKHPIELIRIDRVTGDKVVVDRADVRSNNRDQQFGNQLRDVLTDRRRMPVPPAFREAPPNFFNGIRLRDNHTFWATWARFTRPWGYDLPEVGNPATYGMQPDERAPRFVLAQQEVKRPFARSDPDDPNDYYNEYRQQGDYHNITMLQDYIASSFNIGPGDPDDDVWFDSNGSSGAGHGWDGYYRSVYGIDKPELRRKPTFFNMNVVYQLTQPGQPDPVAEGIYPPFNDPTYEYGRFFYDVQYPDPPGTGVPNKGWAGIKPDHDERYTSSLDMSQKDADFQSVGEIADVWLRGHKLTYVEGPPLTWTYDKTERTFSEYMAQDIRDMHDDGQNEDEHVRRINRLRPRLGGVLGVAETGIHDPLQGTPSLPAHIRLFDAFVCDGPGFEFNPITDVREDYVLNNALAFSGALTPGLINVNTAPVEVMRALPHWNKLVHESLSDLENSPTLVASLPRSGMPEATVNYRERFHSNTDGESFGVPGGADWSDRRREVREVREDRGLASIGELRLLDKDAADDFDPYNENGIGSNNFIIRKEAWTREFDGVDSFYRIANLVTTRSDVFTVYFRIRRFRQNPAGRLPGGYVGPVWDATDPEFIVDDARYVMLVDRSEVDKPGDRPKILYLEKVPN